VERIAQRVGDRPVYVSIDIDVLDPAHAPGTGTPEAGGLTSRELLAALRSFARLNLVGADVVEVAPAYDHAQITGIARAGRHAAPGHPACNGVVAVPGDRCRCAPDYLLLERSGRVG
jgi:agmatinase